MKILHICNDFTYSKVHSNLHKDLDLLGFQQAVYHPLRSINNIGKNVFSFQEEKSEIIYSELLKNYHRLFFRHKINFLYNDLKNKIDFESFDILYASTLFSDGSLAYKIFNEFKIPYIVALRNTDVNLFLKLRPDLYLLAKNILLKSKKIIFISPSLKELFFSNIFFSKFESQLNSRIKIIPNGIDAFWLSNQFTSKKKKTNKFLFIGRFDKNKNVIRLISSLEQCRDQVPGIELNLVGGGGNLHSKVLKLVANKDWINYHGQIHDKEQLIKIFRMNDFFAMPSIHETFGLVYIEALLQGLPILYTKGQGVDGLFNDEVGIATLPKKRNSIVEDIKCLMENRNIFVDNIEHVNFSLFDWRKIALLYKDIFENI